MKKGLYRAKSDLSNERMNELGIPHENGWVYGGLVGGWILGEILEGGEEYIQPEWWISIQEGTVGQALGIQDRNGTEMYDGDIINVHKTANGCSLLTVRLTRLGLEAFYTLPTGKKSYECSIKDLLDVYKPLDFKSVEIVGNMYDDPELLS